MNITPVSNENNIVSKRYNHTVFGTGLNNSTSAAPASGAFSKFTTAPASSAPAATASKPAVSEKPAKSDEFLNKVANMPPAAVGLGSAIIWFGVGLGLDRLVGSIFKGMKTSMKSSLIWNGVFGLAMGAMSYWRARK